MWKDTQRVTYGALRRWKGKERKGKERIKEERERKQKVELRSIERKMSSNLDVIEL
jgi:hypothetical protein